MLRGELLDVAVDVHLDSRTFRRHVAIELRERDFALRFSVPSEMAHFFYN